MQTPLQRPKSARTRVKLDWVQVQDRARQGKQKEGSRGIKTLSGGGGESIKEEFFGGEGTKNIRMQDSKDGVRKARGERKAASRSPNIASVKEEDNMRVACVGGKVTLVSDRARTGRGAKKKQGDGGPEILTRT